MWLPPILRNEEDDREVSDRSEGEPAAPHVRRSDASVQDGRVHEGGDFDLPLNGGTIDQCCVDHALTLHIGMDPSNSWSVRIEGDFTLNAPEQAPALVQIHHGTTPGDVNLPINLLLHRTCRQASVLASGGLFLAFDGDVELEVAPGEQYEAWNVVAPDQALWVGGVAGDVSIFPPTK